MAAIKTFHNGNLFIRRGLQPTSIPRMNAFLERRCKFLGLPTMVVDHMRIVVLSADRRQKETSKRFQTVIRIDGTSFLQTILLTLEQVYWNRYSLFDDLNQHAHTLSQKYLNTIRG